MPALFSHFAPSILCRWEVEKEEQADKTEKEKEDRAGRRRRGMKEERQEKALEEGQEMLCLAHVGIYHVASSSLWEKGMAWRKTCLLTFAPASSKISQLNIKKTKIEHFACISLSF